MPFILRRSADQYPKAGWPRTDTDWVVAPSGRSAALMRRKSSSQQLGAGASPRKGYRKFEAPALGGVGPGPTGSARLKLTDALA